MKNLRDKMVTKGMGSGIPQNQRLAGASNPNQAAKMATNTLSLAEKEEQADLIDSINRKVELIATAKKEGFEPSIDVPEFITFDNMKTPINFDQVVEDVEKVFLELENWEAKRIEKDLEENYGEEYAVPSDDPLYNPIRDTKRRREIEKNLEPLDFENMIFNGYTTQEISVRKNFQVTFRTLNTNQSLWIESMTLDLQDQSVQYGRHWMSLVQLAVSLDAINGKEISPAINRFYRNNQEDEFKKALQARMDYIGQLPQVITDDLIIQFAWFSARVRKLMSGDVVEKVGNY